MCVNISMEKMFCMNRKLKVGKSRRVLSWIIQHIFNTFKQFVRVGYAVLLLGLELPPLFMNSVTLAVE